MAKTVGFLCALKPEWLDKTAELVLCGSSNEEIRNELDSYVACEIQSPDNIRKTRIALMNLWVHPFEDDYANRVRELAITAMRNGNSEHISMHWCMALLKYDIFSDVAEAIGKITGMQEEFSSLWLRKKILEKWGGRETVLRSVSMVLQTMRQMGVINSDNNIHTVNRKKIADDQTGIILMKTILALKLKPYYEPSELAAVAQMFPFEYEASSDIIFGSQAFEFGNFGGSPVIVG